MTVGTLPTHHDHTRVFRVPPTPLDPHTVTEPRNQSTCTRRSTQYDPMSRVPRWYLPPKHKLELTTTSHSGLLPWLDVRTGQECCAFRWSGDLSVHRAGDLLRFTGNSEWSGVSLGPLKPRTRTSRPASGRVEPISTSSSDRESVDGPVDTKDERT